MPGSARQRSESLDPSKRLTQFVHDVWTEDDGIPQSTIDAIVQTPDKYLWIGTQEGLVRFNGMTFTVFDKTNTPAFEREQKIRTIYVDHAGRMWIGLEGGLVMYDKGRFTNMSSESGAEFGAIAQIAEDADQMIWIATVNKGIFRTEGSEFEKVRWEGDVKEKAVSALLPNPDGSFWVGTQDGLYLVRNSRATRYGTKEGLHHAEIESLYRDREGTLWIGTFDGINILRRDQVQPAPLEPLNDIRAHTFFEDTVGTMWIGSYSSGVMRITAGDLDIFSEKNGLTHNSISSLYEDHESGMWIGTNGGGLNRLREGKFTTFTQQEGLSSNMIFTVFEDPDGGMWFGSESRGVTYYKNNTFKIYDTSNGLSSNDASALAASPDGSVWIGTYGDGLNRIKDGRITHIGVEDGLPDPFIAALYSDPDGTLWIGTNSGVVRMSREGSFRSWGTEDGLFNTLITSITRDIHGNLWVGNWDGGLHKMVNNRFVHFSMDDGLGSNKVMYLYGDTEGSMWVATNGGGLSRVREGEIQTYTMNDGLFNELIHAVVEDNSGYLWITSNNGISRVKKSQFDAFDRKQIQKIEGEVFTKADGLRSKEMNGGLQPPAWKGADGRLWFPSIEGVAMIDPMDIRINDVVPPVVIEELIVNGDPVDPNADLIFKPGVEKLEISFAALTYESPELVRYKYKLIGQDEDWIEIGPEREIGLQHASTKIPYTNLRNGSYEFRVQATNHDGVTNPAGASLKFEIRPHFSETAWFIVLCILGGIAVLGTAIRIRTVQMGKRQREIEHERDKARAAHNFKSVILDNLNHEFRTPLTGILGYADLLEQELHEDQREFAGYIITNGRRLLSTLDSLLELARIQNTTLDFDQNPTDIRAVTRDVIGQYRDLAREKQLAIELFVAENVPDVELDPKAYQHALSSILDNAIKFTDEGRIDITISHADGVTEIRIRDTGVGIRSANPDSVFEPFKQLSEGLARSFEGAGVGLTIARHLIQNMNGAIEVESSSQEGTTFLIGFSDPEAPQSGRNQTRSGHRGHPGNTTERAPLEGKNGSNPSARVHSHPDMIESPGS